MLFLFQLLTTVICFMHWVCALSICSWGHLFRNSWDTEFEIQSHFYWMEFWGSLGGADISRYGSTCWGTRRATWQYWNSGL
jgi:hypothetical protein